MSSLVSALLARKLHFDVISKYCRVVWKFEWDAEQAAKPEHFDLLQGLGVYGLDEERELGIIEANWLWLPHEDIAAWFDSLGWIDCYSEVVAFFVDNKSEDPVEREKMRIARDVLYKECTVVFSDPRYDLFLFHWTDYLMRSVVRLVAAW